MGRFHDLKLVSGLSQTVPGLRIGSNNTVEPVPGRADLRGMPIATTHDAAGLGGDNNLTPGGHHAGVLDGPYRARLIGGEVPQAHLRAELLGEGPVLVDVGEVMAYALGSLIRGRWRTRAVAVAPVAAVPLHGLGHVDVGEGGITSVA